MTNIVSGLSYTHVVTLFLLYFLTAWSNCLYPSPGDEPPEAGKAVRKYTGTKQKWLHISQSSAYTTGPVTPSYLSLSRETKPHSSPFNVHLHTTHPTHPWSTSYPSSTYFRHQIFSCTYCVFYEFMLYLRFFSNFTMTWLIFFSIFVLFPLDL